MMESLDRANAEVEEALAEMDDVNYELYTLKQIKDTVKELSIMALEHGIGAMDVIHASWQTSRDLVKARLRRDLEDKEEKE